MQIEEIISYDLDNKRYVMPRRAVLLTMQRYAQSRGFCYIHPEYAIADFIKACNGWYSDRDGEPVEFKQ